MKKLLALVLALVMTLSLAVVGSNAAFKDAKDVNETYTEAVDVLSGMGVFNGYKNADGTYSFQPKGDITRAEVAAIVYRLYTADVTDKQASLYATYNKFSDMNGAAWAAGYIGYCANAGLIKGYDAKTFGPSDKVTGYQALAMILRAVGYDKNNEFTGADWQLHVAQTAQQLGILKNVKNVDLNAAASRELVAELLFRTAAEVPTVTYTAALGYSNMSALIGGTKNATLGYKNFGLTKDETYGTDKWGRPAYVWYGENTNNSVYNENSKDVLYATVSEKPIASYTTAQTECQVAQDYGFKGSKTLTTYTNGLINKGTVTMEATDTVGKIGAQGRLTEVYEDRIVMIDTYLAVVTKVVAARLDAAGHEIAAAYTELRVYDGQNESAVAGNVYTISGNDYAKGDYILLNAVTTGAANKALNETAANKYYEVVGKAESFTGAQSTIWHASNQHVVGGTTYDDAYNYILDAADNTANVNFNWFKDQYGNVIGSAAIENNYSYAILTSLGWKTGLPAGYAVATLRYVDGTEAKDVVVKAIAGDEGDTTNIFGGTWKTTLFTPMATDAYSNVPNFNSNGYAYVSDEGRYNGMYNGYALYAVETNADESVNLTPTTYVAAANANVTKGVTTLVVGPGLGDRIYADNATVFVVRSGNATKGYTYTNYVGKDNVPSFTADSDAIFYVDTNNDKVADYVYVQNGTVDGEGNALVVARSNQTGWNLFNNENVYALRYAQVNGADVAEGAVMASSSKAGQITKMADSVNEMYYVTYSTDGLVDTATAVTSAGQAIGTSAATTVYKMIDKVYTLGEGTLVTEGTNIKNSNNVSVTSWNMTGVPVYGDYTDLKSVTDFSKTNTYIVVDTATKAVAKAVYVYNIPESEIVPTTYTVNAVTVTGTTPNAYSAVSDATFSATVTGSTSGFNGSVTATPTWQKLNETTGKYEDYEGTVFVAGHYRAIVALTVVNADGQSYTIAPDVVVTYGSTQYKTGTSFATPDVVVSAT